MKFYWVWASRLKSLCSPLRRCWARSLDYSTSTLRCAYKLLPQPNPQVTFMYNSPCTPLQCFTVVVALLSCRSQAQSSNTGCQQVWCFIYINAIHCKMVLMCCATILIAQINATMVVVVMACQRRLHNTTSVWDGFHGNYLLIPLWCGYCVLRFHQLQRWA